MPANYTNVNMAWPDTIPVPSGQEALAGAKRLVKIVQRHARDEYGWPKSAIQETKARPRKYRLTSGNRRTWTKQGVHYVNPNGNHFGGWKDIVHDISHWAIQKFWPNSPGHGPRHAYIERMLTKHVVKSGWLDGKLKRPDKPKVQVDVKQVRYQRTLAKIKTWEAKERRAKNALKKLAAQRRYYEKAITI